VEILKDSIPCTGYFFDELAESYPKFRLKSGGITGVVGRKVARLVFLLASLVGSIN
jgi:hypothetical protein